MDDSPAPPLLHRPVVLVKDAGNNHNGIPRKRSFVTQAGEGDAGAESASSPASLSSRLHQSPSNRPKLRMDAPAAMGHSGFESQAQSHPSAHSGPLLPRAPALLETTSSDGDNSNSAAASNYSNSTSPVRHACSAASADSRMRADSAAGDAQPLSAMSGLSPAAGVPASAATSSCASAASITPPGVSEATRSLASNDLGDFTDDESLVSPDVEQRLPFYLPTMPHPPFNHAAQRLNNQHEQHKEPALHQLTRRAQLHDSLSGIESSYSDPTLETAGTGAGRGGVRSRHPRFVRLALAEPTPLPRPASAPPACTASADAERMAAAMHNSIAAAALIDSNAHSSAAAAAASSASSSSAAAASASGAVPMSAVHSPSEDWLPCEVTECHFFLAPSEYQSHMILHHYELVKAAREREAQLAKQEEMAREMHRKLNPQLADAADGARAAAPPAAPNTDNDAAMAEALQQSDSAVSSSSLSLVPCDFAGCGDLVDISVYAAHQRAHEDAALAKGARYSAQHGHRKYHPLKPGAHDSDRERMEDEPAASSAAAAAVASPSHPLIAHGAGDQHFVAGIITVLHDIFSHRANVEVYLCNPIQFFFRSKGDGGFGCGYKNIQTLCSALLQFPLFRETLFDGMLSDKQSSESGTTALHSREGRNVRSEPSSGSPVVSPPAAAASSGAPSSARPPASSSARPDVCLPRMPTISALQRLIDQAHQRGFDVVGAAQVGQLRNSKTWIGAVEAHALFCSYGLRSELIDFKSSYVGLMEYVWNYFKARTLPVQYVGSAGVRPAKGAGPAAAAAPIVSPQSPQTDFFNTHASHFNPMQQHDATAGAAAAAGAAPTASASSPLSSPGSAVSSDSSSSASRQRLGSPNSSFAPPLYFQHQGHSRTIIGILRNEKTGRFRLLVLDPDMTGGGVRLLQNLSSSNPRPVVQAALKTLYRNEDNLRAKEYQMVMIASYGLMTAQEQQRSKRPFSTVISAVEPGQQGEGDEPRAAQQTGPQPERHHDRGAGGSTAGKSAPPSTSSRRWKLERREVDERAPARRGVDAAAVASSSPTAGPSSHRLPSHARARSPADINLDDSDECSPEALAADRRPAATPGASAPSTAVGAGAKGRQEQVQHANISSQVQFAQHGDDTHHTRRNGHTTAAVAAAAETPAAAGSSSAVPSSSCVSYRFDRFIPVIPPSRSRLPAVSRLPGAPRVEQPRSLSAAPKLAQHTQHTHHTHHTHTKHKQSQQDQRTTHAAAATAADTPRSCTRIPAGSRLLQPRTTNNRE